MRSIPLAVIDEVIVVDNGSTDATARTAERAGARVVAEPVRGYRRACWVDAQHALRSGAGVVAFMDGDGSDCPECMPDVVGPVARGEYDFVLGSRVRGHSEPGSLNLPQLAAAKLAGWLMRLRYDIRFTDMSPFRAIRADTLAGLGMREMMYG